MKYMLMMFGDAETMTQERSPEWIREMLGFMQEFNTELNRNGEFVTAEGLALPGTAKTVSLTDGQVVVTDGPFAEAKEQVGGFYLIDVPSIEEAVEWGKKIPLLPSDKLEVRKGK